MVNRRIRVLIADDSALVRKILTESLANHPEIEVVGTASDAYVARDKILQLNPDVLTLDIEMPRMDGLSFLKLLMQHRPMPVIIISSMTTAGSSQVLEALQAGAVDVMAKPDGAFSASEDGTELARKIKAAYLARLTLHHGGVPLITRPKPPASAGAPRHSRPPGLTRDTTGPTGPVRQYANKQIILMGASTGGTEALKAILTNLTGTLPGICIVQHIPAQFSKAFADRLNTLCVMEVREAVQGDRVEPGLALIAPGGFHMVLRHVGSTYAVDLNQGPPVHHQRPAVEILFDSAVRAGAGPHALALLLTGMGADGAAGLLKLKEAGATTVAQNEESCVVFGMPREAIRLGAAQKILHLDHMAAFIEHHGSEVALPHVGA